MFGWGKDKAVDAAARDYVVEAAGRADIGYRVFMQEVVQILVDAGLTTDAGISSFLKDDRTKWNFVIGIFAEGLMAAPNLLSSATSKKFTEYAIDHLCKANPGPIPSFKVANDVRTLLAHCLKYPEDHRVTVLFYMLDNSGLNIGSVKNRILSSPILMLGIRSTIMNDGCLGAAKAVIDRHKLR